MLNANVTRDLIILNQASISFPTHKIKLVMVIEFKHHFNRYFMYLEKILKIKSKHPKHILILFISNLLLFFGRISQRDYRFVAPPF